MHQVFIAVVYVILLKKKVYGTYSKTKTVSVLWSDLIVQD